LELIMIHEPNSDHPHLIAQLEAEIDTLRSALKPFATARINDEQDAGAVVDWEDQHDADGVSLIWDADFQFGSTLTIGQFKRAARAYRETAR
jgi:hypothetical protein